MEYSVSDIKEEYVEPNETDLLVKKEPIDIKCEQVRIKEEDIKPELYKYKIDAVLKKEDVIGQAYHVKEEYIEFDSFPSCIDIKTEDDSFVSNEFTNENQNGAPEAPPTLAPEKCPENTCQQCEREFDDTNSLERHMSNFHSAKYHKCSLCDEEFGRQGSLDVHLQERHQDKIRQCEACYEIFTDINDLKSHTSKKHDKKAEKQKEKVKDTTPLFTEMMLLPWKCQECGEEFTTEKPLKIHVDVVHKGEAHPYGCKLCNFIGKDSDNLKRHMLRKHPNSTPAKYECEYCGHTSVRRSELNNHLKMHTGEKSNKCNQCDYASSDAGNLLRHLKTHNGEKKKQMQPK